MQKQLLAPRAYWPDCEACGGQTWKFQRKSEGGGLETQTFYCSECDHHTVLFVNTNNAAATKLATGG